MLILVVFKYFMSPLLHSNNKKPILFLNMCTGVTHIVLNYPTHYSIVYDEYYIIGKL